MGGEDGTRSHTEVEGVASMPAARRFLVAILSALVLVVSGGIARAEGDSPAELVTVIWRAAVEGRLTAEQGFSVRENRFVPADRADVILQGDSLVALNGAGLQPVEGEFASLRRIPARGYGEEAPVRVGGTYAVRSAGGQYAKLHLGGTFIVSLSGGGYESFGIAAAVQLSSPAAGDAGSGSGAGSAPAPGGQGEPTAPPPAEDPGGSAAPPALQASAGGGRVVLTWPAFATPNDGYYVFRGTAPGEYGPPLTDFPGTERTYTDTSVTAGRTYYYVVRAYRNGQYGPGTAEVAVTVTAGAAARTIHLQVGSRTARVNGVEQTLDVPPQLLGGRTMVPLRFLAEALGASLRWDGAERRIDLAAAGRQITLWVDRQQARVDGAARELDVPPTVVEGRTLVPLRFISENMGARVQFNAADRSIDIAAAGEPAACCAAPPAAAAQPEILVTRAQGRILAVDPQTGKARLLVEDEGIVAIRLSPDRQHLAYSRTDGSLVVDGRVVYKAVWSELDQARGYGPQARVQAWSPDGKAVLFIEAPDTTHLFHGKLYRLDLATGKRTPVGSDVLWADWSADGGIVYNLWQGIVLGADRGALQRTDAGGLEIQGLDVENSRGATARMRPSLARSAPYLAYAGDIYEKVYRRDLRSGEETYLGELDADAFRLSPDGTHLAYVKEGALYVQPAGGAARPLLESVDAILDW